VFSLRYGLNQICFDVLRLQSVNPVVVYKSVVVWISWVNKLCRAMKADHLVALLSECWFARRPSQSAVANERWQQSSFCSKACEVMTLLRHAEASYFKRQCSRFSSVPTEYFFFVLHSELSALFRILEVLGWNVCRETYPDWVFFFGFLLNTPGVFR
jgi:hypothetical protein